MTVVTGLGLLLLAAGTISLLVGAARISLWWPAGMIVFPPAQLVYVAISWSRVKRDFYLQLSGLLLLFFAFIFNLPHFDFNSLVNYYQADKNQMNEVSTGKLTYRCVDEKGIYFYQAVPCEETWKHAVKLKAFENQQDEDSIAKK